MYQLLDSIIEMPSSDRPCSHGCHPIAEAALVIEMGAADIGLAIHPHPTLSETIWHGAEAFEGSITDLYVPGKK
jgi:hypothetical protein